MKSSLARNLWEIGAARPRLKIKGVRLLLGRRAPFRTPLLCPQLLKQGHRIDRRHVNLTDLRSRALRANPISRCLVRPFFLVHWQFLSGDKEKAPTFEARALSDRASSCVCRGGGIVVTTRGKGEGSRNFRLSCVVHSHSTDRVEHPAALRPVTDSPRPACRRGEARPLPQRNALRKGHWQQVTAPPPRRQSPRQRQPLGWASGAPMTVGQCGKKSFRFYLNI